MRYVKGANNPVADALSRIDINAIHHIPFSSEPETLARAQQADEELQNLLKSQSTSLKLSPVISHEQGTEITLICDTSTCML